MADETKPAAKEATKKIRVLKESGLFWLPGKPKKGDEIEVGADHAERLVAAKHAAPVGWKAKDAE
jgi:hypothetical protein